MKIIDKKELSIPEIKVIRYARFRDHRGYFTESYNKKDFSEIDFMKGIEFVQCNESFSKKGTVRGLHFQWNPYMGKLIRVISGRMVDLVLDIRKGAPTFGKIIAHDMPAKPTDDSNEWIWVPPGFAHGNFFTEDTSIEYFCSGTYSPGCEAGISPLAGDIDWSICDPALKKLFDSVAPGTKLITDKDKNGFSVAGWEKDKRSDNFIFGKT
ncbi:dTDP-4-dehydrorhamnose 3,5-epimerase family protein [Candidatus Margulisiibacteriota bacterium]